CTRHCQRLRQDESAWERLEDLARRRRELEAQSAALQEQGRRIAEEVRRAADRAAEGGAGKVTTALLAFIRGRPETRGRIEGETARLCQTRDDQRRQRDELDKEREDLRPLVEAKRQGHWWTKNWWQATLQGNGASRWDELEARAGQLQESVAALEGRLAA